MMNEVTLALQITSSIKDSKTMLCQLKLEYSGIYKLTGDIAEEEKEKFLFINCSSLLFPFLRTEVANITLKSGFQPILMDPVDFVAVYEEYQKQKNKNTRPIDEKQVN